MASEKEFDKLDWIPEESYCQKEETFGEKFVRKFKENPFVPLGCAATSIILILGVKNIGTNNKKKSQMLMRARVLAQGLTVVAVLGGFLLAQKNKNKTV